MFMRPSRSSSDVPIENARQDGLSIETETKQHDGYQWTALSVTTVGALLASIQGSALLIALPNILTELHTTFFTVRAKNAGEQRQPSAARVKREKPGACDGNESASVARAARRSSRDGALATERDRVWRPA